MAARIIDYDPAFRRAFADLNYEWIETYFAIEDEDRLALDDPEGYAIAPGGNIFFVLEGQTVVGTVAMVPHGDGVYELAKMAVRPEHQGKGYGAMLMRRCIEYAREQQAREIMLVTNDSLAPALATYTSAGFEAVENYTDARYERGNLEMRLRLGST